MSGAYDTAEAADERLWNDKVYFRYTDALDETLYESSINAERHRVTDQGVAFVSDGGEVLLLSLEFGRDGARGLEGGVFGIGRASAFGARLRQ
jgi:hypothetical protein